MAVAEEATEVREHQADLEAADLMDLVAVVVTYQVCHPLRAITGVQLLITRLVQEAGVVQERRVEVLRGRTVLALEV